MRLKKGDKVVVIAGSEKGKEGTISKVLPKEEKVIIAGINMVKKHVKPNQAEPEGKITEKEAPIHVSNVAIVDPKTKKPTRVGYRFEEVDGKQVKVRYAKKSGTKLDK